MAHHKLYWLLVTAEINCDLGPYFGQVIIHFNFLLIRLRTFDSVRGQIPKESDVAINFITCDDELIYLF